MCGAGCWKVDVWKMGCLGHVWRGVSGGHTLEGALTRCVYGEACFGEFALDEIWGFMCVEMLPFLERTCVQGVLVCVEGVCRGVLGCVGVRGRADRILA